MDVAFNAFHFWREQYHVVGKQGLALCLSKETERKEGGTTEGLLGLWRLIKVSRLEARWCQLVSPRMATRRTWRRNHKVRGGGQWFLGRPTVRKFNQLCNRHHAWRTWKGCPVKWRRWLRLNWACQGVYRARRQLGSGASIICVTLLQVPIGEIITDSLRKHLCQFLASWLVGAVIWRMRPRFLSASSSSRSIAFSYW